MDGISEAKLPDEIESLDCIVLAGGRPKEGEPLYAITRGRPKALLSLGDRTILEMMIDALSRSRYVRDIAVVGLESDGHSAVGCPVSYVPDRGNLIGNVKAGLEWARARSDSQGPLIFCSADIPTISGEVIDRHIQQCWPFDKALYYILVEREVMEQRFPGAQRTYARLDGKEYAGGDLVVVHRELASGHDSLLARLEVGRKHAWRLALTAGPHVLLKYVLRSLTIADVERTAERILGSPCQVVVSPFAELAMDIDLPEHLELLNRHPVMFA